MTIYGKHFYGMGGPTYDIPADNAYMDMECVVTLDDDGAGIHAQLNAPSRRLAALIRSWLYIVSHNLLTANRLVDSMYN